MAKKDKKLNLEEDLKGQFDETSNTTGEMPPSDSADAADAESKASKEAMGDAKQADNAKSAQADKAGLIDPIAFEITLKAHHPQESYGRCGYRFNKTEPVQIPKADLTGEQIIALADDPWLEFVPVCEA